MGSSRNWVQAFCCVAALGGGAWVLFAYDPSIASFYPPCVFHALTGYQCPGCGTTRALHHLLHGRIAEAFRLNAMMFLLAPFLTVAGTAELRRIFGKVPRPRWLLQPWVGWAVTSAIIGWWIVRNTPLMH